MGEETAGVIFLTMETRGQRSAFSLEILDEVKYGAFHNCSHLLISLIFLFVTSIFVMSIT